MTNREVISCILVAIILGVYYGLMISFALTGGLK
jgi:hypothetical protein